MWNAPNGFFETLLLLAVIGGITIAVIGCVALYFVVTNLNISWGIA